MSDRSIERGIVTGWQLAEALRAEVPGKEHAYELPCFEAPFLPDTATLKNPDPVRSGNVLSVCGLVLVEPPRPVEFTFVVSDTALPQHDSALAFDA